MINLEYNYQQTKILKDITILTSKNKHAEELNNYILNKFPGKLYTKLSIDENIPTNANFNFSTETLNMQNPSDFPPHILYLKEHAIIMLLRNLDPIRGLCNGTRLKIKRISPYIIQSTILNGQAESKTFFIPRIKFNTNKNYPIQFRRTQYPIKLCFAMTINKAQHKTLNKISS